MLASKITTESIDDAWSPSPIIIGNSLGAGSSNSNGSSKNIKSCNALPASCKKLLVTDEWRIPLPHIPPCITHLAIADSYNHPVPDLPSCLRVLRIGDAFDHMLTGLPDSIVCMHLGDAFNNGGFPLGPLTLPASLITLRMGHSFSQALEFLPPALRTVIVGDGFRGPVMSLPQGLLCLVLTGMGYEGPLPLLPDGMRVLALGPRYAHPLPSPLPRGLHVLDLSWCFSLPSFDLCANGTEHPPPTCITTLCLPDNHIRPLDLESYGMTRAPLSLTSFLQSISLPNVTRMCTGDTFNLPIDGLLPNTLEMLSLGLAFDQPVDMLPESLRVLCIVSAAFNRTVRLLPAGLVVFSLMAPRFCDLLTCLPHRLSALFFMGNHQDTTLAGLPKTLKTFEFETVSGYLAPFMPDCFPQGLRHLRLQLHSRYNHAIPLPPMLHTLDLSCPVYAYEKPVILPASLHSLTLSGIWSVERAGSKRLHAFPCLRHLAVIDEEAATSPAVQKVMSPGACLGRLKVQVTETLSMLPHAQNHDVSIRTKDLEVQLRTFTAVDSYLRTPGVPERYRSPPPGAALPCPCDGFCTRCTDNNWFHMLTDDYCLWSTGHR